MEVGLGRRLAFALTLVRRDGRGDTELEISATESCWWYVFLAEMTSAYDAVPAPRDWRVETPEWHALAAALELAAAAPRTLALHGVAQPLLAGALAAAAPLELSLGAWGGASCDGCSSPHQRWRG